MKIDPNLKGMLCSNESQEFSCLLTAPQPPSPPHTLSTAKKKKEKEKKEKKKEKKLWTQPIAETSNFRADQHNQ